MNSKGLLLFFFLTGYLSFQYFLSPESYSLHCVFITPTPNGTHLFLFFIISLWQLLRNFLSIPNWPFSILLCDADAGAWQPPFCFARCSWSPARWGALREWLWTRLEGKRHLLLPVYFLLALSNSLLLSVSSSAAGSWMNDEVFPTLTGPTPFQTLRDTSFRPTVLLPQRSKFLPLQVFVLF